MDVRALMILAVLIVLRSSATIYATLETYIQMNSLTQDELISAFCAIVMAGTGLASILDVSIDGQTTTQIRIAKGSQFLLLLGLHTVVALYLCSRVSRGLTGLLAGNSVSPLQAFLIVLIGMLVIELRLSALR